MRSLRSPSLVAPAAVLGALLVVASAAAAAPVDKVGVLPFHDGAGVSKRVAAALTEAVAGALAKTGVEVVTQQQLKALLDLEAQKQLAGCADDACMAQIGEALGVDALVTGTLAKVGRSYLVGLRSVDVKTGASHLADRRLKHGSIDDVLDVLPAMVAELSAPRAPGAVAAATGATTGAASNGAATAGAKAPAAVAPDAAVAALKTRAPSSIKDVPMKVDAAKLRGLTDGKGLFIAYDDKPADGFAPFFAARKDPTRLYAQRVTGGGREGDKSFDVVFWDPRAKARWQAAFDMKDGNFWLQCGDDKIALKPTKLPKGASFFEHRWQRTLFAVARTDDGTYFVVDRALVPEDNRDFRLFAGRPGTFAYAKVDDVILERDAQVFMTRAGRLSFKETSDGKQASWTPPGGAALPLKAVDIYDAASDAYGRWHLYQEPLGTPCDEALGR